MTIIRLFYVGNLTILNKMKMTLRTPLLKINFPILFMVFSSLLLVRCEDDPEPFLRSDIVTQSPPTTTADAIMQISPLKALYQVNMKLGHDASECTGCVVVNGTPTHVPCRGPGDKCNVSSVISVTASETHSSFVPGNPMNYYIVSGLSNQMLDSLVLLDEFRNDDFFLFPNRSFWVSGSNIDWRLRWMNIPEQYVKRNNDDGLLYYERVSFTSSPLFANE